MVGMLGNVESDTRGRLLRATAELMHARSYVDVGVQDICSRAGVKKGSFYHFFDSKQTLVLETVDLVWKAFVGDVLHICFDPELEPRDRIEALFDHACRTHTGIWQDTGRVLGCPFGNLAAETSTMYDPIRDRVRQVFADWAAVISATIREAVETGELDPDVSPEVTGWSLLATLQGALLIAKVTNDPSWIAEIGEEAVARLWRAAA